MSDLCAKIMDIKRFAVHDGDGIRTTLFLKGCPLRCVWCHNPEGLSGAPEISFVEKKCLGCGECARVCSAGAHTMSASGHHFDRTACVGCGACADACLGEALRFYGREMTVAQVLPLLTEDRAFYETSGGGVTVSGGECLLQADFCAALLTALKAEGIRTAIDTSGAVPYENIAAVLPVTDVILYDVKAVDPAVHRRCTGRDNAQILDNLRRLDEAGAAIEVRYPYVPGYNDREAPAIADLLAGVRHLTGMRVLPYHNYAGSKYLSLGMAHELPPRVPTDAEMQAARQIFKDRGIRVIE